MSVRAHKVTKFEFEEGGSFNLWHDDEVRKSLEIMGYLEEVTPDGGGLLIISIDDLDRILKETEINEYTKNKLQSDIDEAKQNDEPEIRYYCF